jgi:hypothetical protein
MLDELATQYDVRIRAGRGWVLPWRRDEQEEELWTDDKLSTVLETVRDMARAMGGPEGFRARLGGVRIVQRAMRWGGLGRAHNITLSVTGFSAWTAVHELAHAWDATNRWRLSRDMRRATQAGFAHPLLHLLAPKNDRYWYDPGRGPPPCGLDGHFNRLEDFAEAVTAFVYPQEAQERATERGWPYTDPDHGYAYADFCETPRGQFVSTLLVSTL